MKAKPACIAVACREDGSSSAIIGYSLLGGERLESTMSGLVDVDGKQSLAFPVGMIFLDRQWH